MLPKTKRARPNKQLNSNQLRTDGVSWSEAKAKAITDKAMTAFGSGNFHEAVRLLRVRTDLCFLQIPSSRL